MRSRVFCVGSPLTFQQTAIAASQFKEARYQVWLQDDWKIRPRLTLNLGIRWEPTLPAVDDRGVLPGFAPGLKSGVAPNAPAGLIFSGDVQDSILPRDWNNFAPRVGFAWDVTGAGKLVVRSGYGIYFQQTPMAVDRGLSVPFRTLSITANNPLSFENPWGNYPGGNPFPYTTPSLSELQTYKFAQPLTASALNPYARTGYTQNWSFAIERQVGPDASVKASYVGNHALGIFGGTEGNPAIYAPGATTANIDSRRIYKGLASLTYVTPFQSSNYHSLQLGITRRTRRGLSVLANYTFGKVIDDGTQGGLAQITGQPRNPFNRALDAGPPISMPAIG